MLSVYLRLKNKASKTNRSVCNLLGNYPNLLQVDESDSLHPENNGRRLATDLHFYAPDAVSKKFVKAYGKSQVSFKNRGLTRKWSLA